MTYQTPVFSTDFIKFPNIKLHDIPSTGAKLLHVEDGHTDRQDGHTERHDGHTCRQDGHTDRHDEANNYLLEFFKSTYKLTSRTGKVQFEATLNGFNNWY